MVEVNTNVLEAIEELREELRAVSARLARLEGSAYPNRAAFVPEPAKDAPAEAIPEDVLLVISAAVAAFLGERAHIRQVRLISSGGWALQGRVFIQASHILDR